MGNCCAQHQEDEEPKAEDLLKLAEKLENGEPESTAPNVVHIVDVEEGNPEESQVEISASREPTPEPTGPVVYTEDNFKLARKVFEIQNKVRENPKFLITHLQEHKNKFAPGNKNYKIGDNEYIATHEGTSAVDEAVRYLRKKKSMPVFKWSSAIADASMDHAWDIGPAAITGHQGSDGNTIYDRLDRYGKYTGEAGESCSFSEDTAIGIIMQLIIDDGVKGRTHRRSIFNKKYKHVGIGTHSHADLDCCCVINYAEKWKTRPNYEKHLSKAPIKHAKTKGDDEEDSLPPGVIGVSTKIKEKIEGKKKTTIIIKTYEYASGDKQEFKEKRVEQLTAEELAQYQN